MNAYSSVQGRSAKAAMTPFQLIFFSLAAIPLAIRLLPFLLPGYLLEPYYWLNPDLLNRDSSGAARTKWNNMGYWGEDSTFPEAAERLAQKLLDFAHAKSGGRILDLAHGAGESLSLHLSTSTPPSHLHALTSSPLDTAAARSLVTERHGSNISTEITWFTSSASFRPGKDLNHPFNPMFHHMGDRGHPKGRSAAFDDFDDEEDDDEKHEQSRSAQAAIAAEEDKSGPQAPPYDLIYVLDAIYHFPPSVLYFVSNAGHALAPGGVIAYTDMLAPADLSPLMSQMVLPFLLNVPARNLQRRPDLEEYKSHLLKMGYVNVRIEEWTEHVFPGLEKNLMGRFGIWRSVGRWIGGLQKAGWKFVAVRAESPGPESFGKQHVDA